MLRTLVFAVVLALIGSALLSLAIAAFMGVGALRDDDDQAVSDGPDVELAADRRAAVALAPPRDAVIGTDVATADRHARLRAFQQRQAEEASARSFMTRGF